MSDGTSIEQSRAFARAEIECLLGLDEPDPCALFELAGEVLGERRATRCLELVRRARLTQQGGPSGSPSASCSPALN